MHCGEQRQTKEHTISNGVRSLFVLSQCVPFSPAWLFFFGGGEGGGVLGV